MLIPYEKSIQLTSIKDSDVCAIELSPDGKLFAVATTDYLQIWSAGPNLFLLAQLRIQRASNRPSHLIRKVMLVWSSNCGNLAVVCGEGIVEIFKMGYEEGLFELDATTNRTAYIPSCTLHSICIKNVEEFGLPLCVDSLPAGILLGTDQGNLVEMEWNGISRGYPITAPIMIYLPELGRDLPPSLQIISLNHSATLSVIILVLSSGTCLLFHVSYTNRIHFNNSIVLQSQGCVRCCLGGYTHLLALAESDGCITVYRLQWMNDSLNPVELFAFSIATYNHLYLPPSETFVDEVTCLAWNWENDHLAVGYRSRGVAVWNLQNTPVFWHAVTKEETPSCVCFSAIGDALLFAGHDGHLFSQRFLLTNNVLFCKCCLLSVLTYSPNSSFAAYNSTTLLIVSPTTSGCVLPKYFSIPQSFTLNCNWPLLGMCLNGTSSRVLLFTCNDVCLYLEDFDLWKVATGLVDACSVVHDHQ